MFFSFSFKKHKQDLGSKDLQRERILLVCQVIRIGSMDLKDVSDQTLRSKCSSSLKRTNDEIKRPFGIAMVEITEFIPESSQQECEMRLCMPFIHCGEKDSLDSLLKKLAQMKQGELKNQKNGVFVSIQMIHGNSSPQFGDTSPCSVARKMGFPDVIMPGDVRNDLYLTINHGLFISKTSHAKNIEVTVRVFNSNEGKFVSNVIFTGASCDPLSEYRSVVYKHEEKPRWMETIRVSIPIDDYFNCHLVFLFKHRSSSESKDKSEKFFAMSFAKLKNSDQTAISDNIHNLLVYKLEKKTEEDLACLNYSPLASTRDELEEVPRKGSILGLTKSPRMSSTTSIQCPGLTLLTKDSFVISTIICSTKLTQNVDLLKFLKLRSDLTKDLDEIKSRLAKLEDVEGEEKVKFLQDVLDTLFAVFIEYDNENIHFLVFTSLVNIICLISDPKYQQFRQVLDSYIEYNFSFPSAYMKIISALQSHIEGLINQCDSHSNRTNQRNSLCQLIQDEPSLKVMQSLEYLFKFIVRSRKLNSLLHGSRVGGRTTFEKSMKNLLESFRQFIAIDQGDIIKVQAKCLKSFPLAIKDILEVFDATDLCNYLTFFIAHSPLEKLRIQKILYISDIIHIDCLFRRRDCRSILLPVTLSYLSSFIETRDQLEYSTEVICDTLKLLYSIEPTKDDICELMTKVLPVVIKFVSQSTKDEPSNGSLVAILFEVLRLMKADHLTRYLDCFDDKHLVEKLMELLIMFKMLIHNPVYLKNSSDMLLHINSVMLSSLKCLARIIRDRFFVDFEYQLWNNFFHCAISFLTQPSLQLENFPQSKVKKIIHIYGDMRKQAAVEVRLMWYRLDSHKILFVPGIVGLFVEMTLIPDYELRKETIPIFFDMMCCEYYSKAPGSPGIKGNFDEFSREMITQLDKMVEGGRGDDDYKKLLFEKLRDLWENHEAKEAGFNFVKIIARLMRRLLEYRQVVSPLHGNNNECMLCIVDLLEFYLEIGRQELYLRYLYKLVQLHKECENYIEAAHSLMLHARLLSWSNKAISSALRSDSYLNCLTHRELKEKLYLEIIYYFDKGQLWEDCNRLCKELLYQYEHEFFDYNKLANLHLQMNGFYKNIMESFRPDPEYFRVYFYGDGFPSFIRGKSYIFRGKAYENLRDFHKRLFYEYPKAVKANTLNPENEVLNADRQIVLVTKVDPLMEEKKKDEFSTKMVSPKILAYHKTNEIRRFTFSRPIRKSIENENEFAGISIERTTFKIPYPLPGILSMFPVIEQIITELSPIENAIETVQAANDQLKDLILQHLTESNVQMNGLALRLQGIIEPAVNGGIANYESAFFNSPSIDLIDQNYIEQLKNLIADQVPLLECGLELHKAKVSIQLLPLHDHLEKQFKIMKESLETKYGHRALPADVIDAVAKAKKNSSSPINPQG